MEHVEVRVELLVEMLAVHTDWLLQLFEVLPVLAGVESLVVELLVLVEVASSIIMKSVDVAQCTLIFGLLQVGDAGCGQSVDGRGQVSILHELGDGLAFVSQIIGKFHSDHTNQLGIELLQPGDDDEVHHCEVHLVPVRAGVEGVHLDVGFGQMPLDMGANLLKELMRCLQARLLRVDQV